jgi:uncharacterized protein YndB with AHSA1/START domain
VAGQSEELTLAITREFPAVRAVVFQSFVDPSQLAKWFGPKGFTIPSVEFGPRVGARATHPDAGLAAEAPPGPALAPGRRRLTDVRAPL